MSPPEQKMPFSDQPNRYAVILAGGSGTRFWPLSRETSPKQMLQIIGEDSLLRQTIKRLDGFIPPENIYIITTKDLTQDKIGRASCRERV